MESMVRWSWMSRLPRSDSTFLVRMIHRFSTSETDGSGKQRAEHGVLSSGQRVCTGFIGLSFDCLKSFAGARVSKLVLTGAHSTFLNNPYWFQFNLLIFDGQITRNPNFFNRISPHFEPNPKRFWPGLGAISVIESAEPRNLRRAGPSLVVISLTGMNDKAGVPIAWVVSHLDFWIKI